MSLDERLGEEQRRELVELIGEQSGRLTRIVEEILLTQRLDTGDLLLERRAFDVSETVERVVAGTRVWRDPRPVALQLSSGLEAEGDPAMFEQVLVNLLDNAIKYSPPGTEVRVTVERVRASVRVMVADDGPGIPAADHDRIFEKFFRLDPDQETGAAGTGLGLYIARELVRRMRGRLGLLPAGGGATFFVDLPLHHPGR
jgi:two-component system sensor histidine kinase KdpD